ncbi:MAG TPA: beta-propeller fold lactonase family protein [Solirubrobacterales bacterium]|jgi:DNA-binding beta-propeller fold protein YncE|nr:beta-propeller fold lactonase family protein [Solirubrobacterales bacterium]
MRGPAPGIRFALGIFALTALVVLAQSATALGAPKLAAGKAPNPGTLTQLTGKRGCLVDRSSQAGDCARARALDGPGPFMGSRAIALSPSGRQVYVASSKSDAIAIFSRDPKTGRLTQAVGSAGCIAAKGADGCAKAIGLDEPNSVALSPDGKSLYATSRAGNSVASFVRNPRTGALRQLPPPLSGCISGIPLPGCTTGLALVAPDVVVASPDGNNVYVGSFFGNSVAAFSRNPTTGALAQLAGSAACIAEATSGCATGIALKSVEGLAISGDGDTVYAATALSNAVVTLSRNAATGVLTQAADGSGCIVESALAGCTTGVQLSGANAIAVSPNDADVYATSLFSNSVTSFGRATSSGLLAQKEGTAGCLIYLRAAGCAFGRALVAPEGLALSPNGKNVYVTAFKSGAIAVLDRGKSGAVAQKPGPAGCLAARSLPGCTPARALKGASSIALSPDGRHLYSTSFESDAVDVFRRNR